MRIARLDRPARIPPSWAMPIAAFIVEQVYKKHGVELEFTSGREGRHGRGSQHFKDLAFDARVWNLGDDEVVWRQVADEIADRLGKDFDVVLHGKDDPPPHLHVEFDPKDPL